MIFFLYCAFSHQCFLYSQNEHIFGISLFFVRNISPSCLYVSNHLLVLLFKVSFLDCLTILLASLITFYVHQDHLVHLQLPTLLLICLLQSNHQMACCLIQRTGVLVLYNQTYLLLLSCHILFKFIIKRVW